MFICSGPQTRLLLTKSPSFVKHYSLIYKILQSCPNSVQNKSGEKEKEVVNLR